MTIKPKRLQPGDTIGIVAPSSYVTDEREVWLDEAIKVLKSYELNVRKSRHFRSKDKYGISAGSPEERASDINEMFADKDIKAIWCYTGGDTANQILELLSYDLIKRNPKIFIGMSDNTVLLHAINMETGLITFYGGEPKFNPKGNPDAPENFASPYTREQFVKRFMQGEIGEIDRLPGKPWKTVRKGKIEGSISGGHFQRFLKLAGKYDLSTIRPPDQIFLSDQIFLMEGYSEDIEKSLATLAQLESMLAINYRGQGIVIGHMYSFDDPNSSQFSKNLDVQGKRIYLEDLVLEATEEYQTPIIKAPVFGHRCPSTFLPIGVKASIEANANGQSFKLLESCVE